MLTGDNRTTAHAVAAQLGIDDVRPRCCPRQRSRIVRRLQAQGRVVAMAGDGINDAPALAAGRCRHRDGHRHRRRDGERRRHARQGRSARHRARPPAFAATMRNIRQNLFFAFVYNALGVPIRRRSALSPFGWLLSPMLAAAAMSFSSVSVIANALRLRRARV